MPKEEPQPIYPCMAPPPGARRVEHPHDERVVGVHPGRVRRALAKLRALPRT